MAGGRGFLWKFPLGQNVISVCCFFFGWSRSSPPPGTGHHQAEPVPVTTISGAPTLPCPRLQVVCCPQVAGFWQGLCCCPVSLAPPRLPLAPAAGLEPRRAHPHWLSSGTFVGKCESVTNVGIHLFHISWAALSQRGFVLRSGSVRDAEQGWDGAGLPHESSWFPVSRRGWSRGRVLPAVDVVGCLCFAQALRTSWEQRGALQRSLAYRMCPEGSGQKRQDFSRAI